MIRVVEWSPVAAQSPPPFGAALERHLAAYRNETVRRASVSAWALLHRVLLREGLPVGELAFGTNGKPYFTDAPVFFSLSHSGGVCAVSVSDTPTGVDVERTQRGFSPRLIEKCLSPREKAAFDGDFIRLWCRKESIVKLTGEGLTGFPSAVESDDPRYAFREMRVSYNGADYRLTAAFLRGAEFNNQFHFLLSDPEQSRKEASL